MKFIADTAKIIGDVTLGEGVAILYGAVLRGDISSIHIGKNSNVQDNCVIHVSPNKPCTIGEHVTIGHGAVIHSVTIGNRVIIGMNATLLNDVEIEDDCIIAAGAVVSPRTKIPSGTLWAGVPASQLKELTEDNKTAIVKNAEEYMELVKNEGQD